jgi:hypothetical protein
MTVPQSSLISLEVLHEENCERLRLRYWGDLAKFSRVSNAELITPKIK